MGAGLDRVERSSVYTSFMQRIKAQIMTRRKTNRRRGLPKPALGSLVADFQRENKNLLVALELFEISNNEYERAMRALTHSPTATTTSTDGTNAIVVE